MGECMSRSTTEQALAVALQDPDRERLTSIGDRVNRLVPQALR
jgi:hypothetical protein